jgi:hypothetical protein
MSELLLPRSRDFYYALGVEERPLPDRVHFIHVHAFYPLVHTFRTKAHGRPTLTQYIYTQPIHSLKCTVHTHICYWTSKGAVECAKARQRKSYLLTSEFGGHLSDGFRDSLQLQQEFHALVCMHTHQPRIRYIDTQSQVLLHKPMFVLTFSVLQLIRGPHITNIGISRQVCFLLKGHTSCTWHASDSSIRTWRWHPSSTAHRDSPET